MERRESRGRARDGFDLALHPGSVPARDATFLHFGFSMPDPDHVRDLLARMGADGVSIVEHDDEPEIVSFKCTDPDSWRVEVYWERI